MSRLFSVSGPPAKIGHFALVRNIGEGGMGTVWCAHDERLDREVALKFIHRQRADSAHSQRRLLREAKALGGWGGKERKVWLRSLLSV